MKINFNEWKIGGKLIFIATVVAVISLFMKWVDMGIMSASGFQQQGYFFLILYIYPMVKLLQNKPINKMVGIICGAVAIILGVGFILSKSVDIFGESINVSATGLYVYIISAIMLTVGVVKYEELD